MMTETEAHLQKKQITDHILNQGFDVVGFCDVKLDDEQIKRQQSILTQKQAGDMDWLWETKDIRNHPEQIFPEAKTAIVVGSHLGRKDNLYKRGQDLDDFFKHDQAYIAQYARAQKDYHIWMKKKLKQVGRFISETYGFETRPYVDTAPIAEKQLAENAGIGWQGKHSNIVSLEFGSKLMLGVLLTSMDLPKDRKHMNFCGACRRCIQACPTNALDQPNQLNIQKCISYFTIEHKGDIPQDISEKMGNHIFGCDICTSVCPHNRKAKEKTISYNEERDALKNIQLKDLQHMNEEEFRKFFAGTPIKRTGHSRMQRNIKIALKNAKMRDQSCS